jgi:chromosome segregation ATPase
MAEDVIKALVSNEEFYKKIANIIYDRLKNDIVLSKFDDISKALRELSTAVQKNSDHIVLLWEKMYQQEELMKSIIDAIRGVQLTLQKHSEVIETHSKAIEGLQRGIEKHSIAIENLQKVVDTHTKAIESLQKAVETHSKVIEGLQKVIEDHSKAIESLQKAVEKHTEVIESLQRVVDTHSKAIENLQKAVETHSKVIEGIQRSIEKHSIAIESLQKAVETHSKVIEGLQKTTEMHSKVIEGLQQAILKLSTEIGGFTMRAGKGLEKAIMNIYKKALELHGIDPDKVRHGRIKDVLGVVDKDKEFEVDFYETNDYVYVFEVKNYADEGVLEQMRNRIKLFSALYKKPIKFFIIANYIERSIKEEAEREGAITIASYVLEDE